MNPNRFFSIRIYRILLYSRLAASVAMLVLAFSGSSRYLAIALGIWSPLTGLYGSLRRKEESVTLRDLRQWHAKIDTVFWFSCLFYLCVRRHDFSQAHTSSLFALVSSELCIILFGFLKFRERIAFHTVLSRCWTFILLTCFVRLVYGLPAELSFRWVFWWGLLVQAEVLLMACILNRNVVGMAGIIQALGQARRHA